MMNDTRIRFSVSRRISSWCDENWFCNGPIPENWDTMDRDERFSWLLDNVDDIYTNDEWPEDTLTVESVEVEND